jgi:plastocyanin
MRKLLASLLALAVLAGAFAASAYSASRSVQVKDNFFSSKSLRVKRGDTVTWRWAGRNPHNVVVMSGPVRFSSKVQPRAATGAR